MPDFLLQQNGDYLLQQNGDKIILNLASVAVARNYETLYGSQRSELQLRGARRDDFAVSGTQQSDHKLRGK